METYWIDPGDERWLEALANVEHDLYHLPEYVELCSRIEGGRPAAFCARRGSKYFLQPLLIRDLPEGSASDRHDAISPYGYSGPVGSTGDPGFIADAIDELITASSDRGLVTLLVRQHPLIPVDDLCLGRVGTVRTHGRTVVVDVAGGHDAVRAGMRLNTRNEISRAERVGLSVSEDTAWESLDAFAELYRTTMSRAGAESRYFYDTEYFARLRGVREGQTHLFCVRQQSELVAAGIFSSVGSIVEYLYSGSTRTAPGATRLMLDHVFRRAAGEGFRHVHLGGGVGSREDSLFDFKAGFSTIRADFKTWRVVVDPDEYARLSPDAPATDFFPAYRAERG